MKIEYENDKQSISQRQEGAYVVEVYEPNPVTGRYTPGNIDLAKLVKQR